MRYPLLWSLGTGELAIILVIVLIIFGVGKLPEIGAGLGKGISSFKKGIRGEDKDDESKSDKTLSS